MGLRAPKRIPEALQSFQIYIPRPKRAPRGHPDGPKAPRIAESSLQGSQDGPKTAQEAPKGLTGKLREAFVFRFPLVFALFWPCRFSGFSTRQDGPRCFQNRNNTAPEASKSTPRRPKTVPKQQQRRPRPPKRAPRRPEERPNRGTMNQKSEPAASGVPQEAPRGPQETPKDTQEAPKRPQEAPKRPKRDPKTVRRPILDRAVEQKSDPSILCQPRERPEKKCRKVSAPLGVGGMA